VKATGENTTANRICGERGQSCSAAAIQGQFQCAGPVKLAGDSSPIKLAEKVGIPYLTKNWLCTAMRRLNKVWLFDQMLRAGMGGKNAARMVGVRHITVWRWHRSWILSGKQFHALIPKFARSGRGSWQVDALPKLPARLVDLLEGIGAVCGSQRAWHFVVEQPGCPAELREFVKSRRYLPSGLRDLAGGRRTADGLVRQSGRWLVLRLPRSGKSGKHRHIISLEGWA